MITPISYNKIGIEPIKVPHKTMTFTGLGSIVNDASEKVAKSSFLQGMIEKAKPLYDGAKKITANTSKKVTEYAKKLPDLAKNVYKFLSETFDKIKKFAVKSYGDFKDISKNPGRKTRAVRNVAIATTAVAGAGAGVGGVKHAIKK